MKPIYILLATLLILAGCSQQPESSLGGGSTDPTRLAQVNLATIGVEGSAVAATGSSDVATRAERSISPLPVGQTFRLYAFARGVTDINKLIATRTYTIATTAGTPVMDTPQGPLYLPLGDVDIYLVGPVRADLNAGQTDESGTPLPPQMVEVAADYGVFPQHGIDLIASRTELKVVPNTTNTITAATLSHKMARMEVVVQRPDFATYQNLKVNIIQLKNQSLTGEYTFGADGGAVTPADEGDATFEPAVIEQEEGKTYLIRELMIPRKDTYMKVGVFFTCYISETEQVSRRMESGTLKYPLTAGQNNRFETRPNISTDLLFRYRLLPWDDVTMPEAPIRPNADVLFSYSGADAPTERGGKRYWRDRSGNGRDAELVGNVKYNATEKYYYTTDASAYIRVPDLGQVPVYTFELMATSGYAAQGTVATFLASTSSEAESNVSMEVNLPRAQNEIAFYARRNVGTEFIRNVYYTDKGLLENITTWGFSKNATQMSIRRNGEAWSTPQDITGKPAHGPFTFNKLLKWYNNGWNPTKIKLYGARMSSTVLTDDALKQNHRNDMMTLTQIDVSRPGYIRDGLILDLEGDAAPATINGKTVWPDKSGVGNHAENFGATYNGSEMCYDLTSKTAYLKLIRTLGTHQSFTVEFVVQPPEPSVNFMIYLTSVDNNGDYREFTMHYPYTGDAFYIDTPFANYRGSNNRLQYTTLSPPLPYGRSTKHQLSITRTANVSAGIDVRMSGVLVTKSIATGTPLNEMKYCYIGQSSQGQDRWGGKMYALRIYNRVLTDAERQVNYQVDKVKYNLYNINY